MIRVSHHRPGSRVEPSCAHVIGVEDVGGVIIPVVQEQAVIGRICVHGQGQTDEVTRLGREKRTLVGISLNEVLIDVIAAYRCALIAGVEHLHNNVALSRCDGQEVAQLCCRVVLRQPSFNVHGRSINKAVGDEPVRAHLLRPQSECVLVHRATLLVRLLYWIIMFP